jgi:hypothetical protein
MVDTGPVVLYAGPTLRSEADMTAADATKHPMRRLLSNRRGMLVGTAAVIAALHALRTDVAHAAPISGDTSTPGSIAVNGVNFATTGESDGVGGGTFSAGSQSAGVWGEAYSTTGQTYGVFGKTTSGSTDASGVKCLATNGVTNGVWGAE